LAKGWSPSTTPFSCLLKKCPIQFQLCPTQFKICPYYKLSWTRFKQNCKKVGDTGARFVRCQSAGRPARPRPPLCCWQLRVEQRQHWYERFVAASPPIAAAVMLIGCEHAFQHGSCVPQSSQGSPGHNAAYYALYSCL